VRIAGPHSLQDLILERHALGIVLLEPSFRDVNIMLQAAIRDLGSVLRLFRIESERLKLSGLRQNRRSEKVIGVD